MKSISYYLERLRRYSEFSRVLFLAHPVDFRAVHYPTEAAKPVIYLTYVDPNIVNCMLQLEW